MPRASRGEQFRGGRGKTLTLSSFDFYGAFKNVSRNCCHRWSEDGEMRDE